MHQYFKTYVLNRWLKAWATDLRYLNKFIGIFGDVIPCAVEGYRHASVFPLSKSRTGDHHICVQVLRSICFRSAAASVDQGEVKRGLVESTLIMSQSKVGKYHILWMNWLIWKKNLQSLVPQLQDLSQESGLCQKISSYQLVMCCSFLCRQSCSIQLFSWAFSPHP